MSKLIYIIPWAICDTETIYIKKVEMSQTEVPQFGDVCDDWTVKKVIPSPDGRSKDIFIELDVYCGYDFKNRSKDVSVLKINNSIKHLQELDYVPANESELAFIRQKVLKLDKVSKRKK